LDFNSFLDFYETAEGFLFENFQESILFYSIALAAIIGKLKESSKRNYFSAWSMYLMGTLFHELSHFILSLVTYGKPFWFSIIPSSGFDKGTGERTITLGHIKSKNVQWWNVFFISMSPLLLMPLSFWVYENFFNYFEVGLWSLFLYIFTIVSLLFSSIPSDVDFKNVFNKHTPINLLIPSLFFAIWFFIEEKYILEIGGLF
jgi:hypothetical protein